MPVKKKPALLPELLPPMLVTAEMRKRIDARVQAVQRQEKNRTVTRSEVLRDLIECGLDAADREDRGELQTAGA